MKNLNEDELMERLCSHRKNHKITHADITSPDYEVWGRAREWKYHQAVCLLSGMTPLSKPYFDILIANRSPLDIIHWFSYYPLTPQDQIRLINIDRLVKPLLPDTKQTIQPRAFLIECQSLSALAPNIPKGLLAIVEQFGPHPSLNLPNIFDSSELNPDVFINSAKMNERKARPLAFKATADPIPPPLPPKPKESPLLICKRLFPLELSKRWEGADGFSLHEALLLHYGIDPDKLHQVRAPRELLNKSEQEFTEYLSRHFYGNREWLISSIDENKIIDLLRRAIHLGNLTISDLGIVSTPDIVSWMESKKLSFPIQKAISPKEDQPTSEESLKQLFLTYDLKRFRPEQLAKLLCRIIAADVWKEKKILKLPSIRKHIRFKQAIGMAKKILKKTDEISDKTIDDWIRDLSPTYKPKK